MTHASKCAGCGADLALDAAPGLCPKCATPHPALAQESETVAVAGPDIPSRHGTTAHSFDSAATTAGTAMSQPPHAPVSSLAPGQAFGPYQIIRLLGKGGMGEVYEALHEESGRRLALKVLNHSLDSPEARKRFLREGRLAAAVSHPNVVYIYGTEEIEGIPVITMEYVPAGTLKDRVRERGPLPIAEAVDLILQIITGLEAAEAKGVLHRDIKPANCFLDTDGSVKIGDFGLSVSTMARGETQLTLTGTVLGTPGFSSPEQLRGDDLDVRSDIYSLGVTLYYLLTGKTPFEGEQLMKVLANVLERPAESPRKFRREIPDGLAQVILRCLEKQPASRCKTYAELRAGLAPFSSTAPVPARLGVRFVAGLIDALLVNAIFWGILLPNLPGYEWGKPALYFTDAMLAISLIALLFGALYYGLPEGLWGASAGKAICRLRVVDASRVTPNLSRGLVRALLFVGIPSLPSLLAWAVPVERLTEKQFNFAFLVLSALPLALRIGQFLTARERNGFAAVHDLLTGTRVIEKPIGERQTRAAATEAVPAFEEIATRQRLGPYEIIATLEERRDATTQLGYDPRLQRQVWIRVSRAETPPVATERRGVARAARLRWLNGSRASTSGWDAFERPTGAPFLEVARSPQTWSNIRRWMLDLSEELSAAARDETLPARLALNQIWITTEGRARLLDFPAPGLEEPSPALTSGNSSVSPRELLVQFAAAATHNASAAKPSAPPIPLYASEFLRQLPALPNLEAITEKLCALMRKPHSVTPLRRASVIIACGFPFLAVTLFAAFVLFLINRLNEQAPHIFLIQPSLQRAQFLRNLQGATAEQALELRDLETILRAAHQETISDPAFLGGIVNGVSKPEGMKVMRDLAAGRAAPTPAEISAAVARRKSSLHGGRHWFERDTLGSEIRKLILPSSRFSFLFVILPSLACALLLRTGLFLRVSQVAIVNSSGAKASRLRCLLRALIAWSPGLALPFVTELPAMLPTTLALLTIQATGACWAISNPPRGIQDRLAGTWLVPR